MENSIEYQEKFSFGADDFLPCGISPFAVLKMFNHASTVHGELLGVGFEKMLSQNLMWVSMRIKFEVVNMPKPNQELIITTYPSGKNMLEYDRDFLIFDSNHNLMIRGMNKFCLMNSQTRRIAKLTTIDAPVLDDKEPCFEGRFLKTDTFEPEFLADYSYQISDADIDLNGHANNAVYAKVVATLLERETRKLKFFQINYLKETLLGNRLDVFKKSSLDSLDIVGKLCEGETSFSSHIEFEK